MEDAAHGDSDLVDQLVCGFDLTGSLPESQVFARKLRPATMSCVELRRISELCRHNMLQTVVSSGDPDLDGQLYAATLKEVNKGFLTGPVKPSDLPEGSTLTRRFGVKQKSKTRPIDDYKASFVNSSVSQTETATVHTVDHIASLIACILRVAEELGTSVSLSAKTWDLADAYKQIPLSDHAFDNDGFLAVYNPTEKKAEIFQQKALPFGSVASVTALLRVAHGIWKVGARLLRLMWTSYFDDFLSVTASETSRHTDLVVSSLFSILGWKLSEDKLIDYHTMCKVLGVEFDMRMSGQGLSAVANTTDRVNELCEEIDSILTLGSLKRADGERLRGRLQFASGQLFGRSARNRMRTLSKHISSGRATFVTALSWPWVNSGLRFPSTSPGRSPGRCQTMCMCTWMLLMTLRATQGSGESFMIAPGRVAFSSVNRWVLNFSSQSGRVNRRTWSRNLRCWRCWSQPCYGFRCRKGNV